MLTSEAKRRLVAFGMFALPIVLVKVASTLLGGPSGAQAQTTPASAPPSPPDATAPALELTPREKAALERIDRLGGTAFGRTPMLHARAHGGPIVVDRTPDEPGVPRFQVKAIMVSSTGNRALIDGTSHQVGDALRETGWLIIDINGTTRSVTIRDPETGRVASSTVEGPGLD